MWLVMVILLRLAAPMVELIVIIGLCIANRTHKNKIKELTKRLDAENGRTETECCVEKETEKEWVLGEIRSDKKWAVIQEQNGNMTEHKREGNIHKEQRSVKQKKAVPEESGSMGTIALMIGVVFVVLAGLVFATTTWEILPDAAKVFLVLALAGMFFSVSFLAEKWLHIHKTGNGFYVLGSIFLFLSVLAAAYFRLLGPAYVLTGQNRWRVLWVGSLLTVVMLFLGIRRFCDWIYTQTCFWGLTVSVTFLLLANGVSSGIGFVSGMSIYACLLVMGDWLASRVLSQNTGSDKGGRGENSLAAELLIEGFCRFAPVHFWVFGIPMALYGFVGGFFQVTEWFAWYVLLALGAVAIGAAVQILQCSKNEGKGLVCKRRWLWKKKVFFMLTLAGAVHYLAAWGFFEWFGGALTGKVVSVITAEAVVGVWLLGREKWNLGVRTDEGDAACMVLLLGDVLMLQWLAMLGRMAGRLGDSVGLEAALTGALAGALLLIVVMGVQGKKWTAARAVFPLLLWCVVALPFRAWLDFELEYRLVQGWKWMVSDWSHRGMLEFLMIGGLAWWDNKQKAGYRIPILMIGTWNQFYYFSKDEVVFPFFLMLSAYLLTDVIKMRRGEITALEKEGRIEILCRAVGIAGGYSFAGILYRTAAFYAMAGVWFVMYPFTAENGVLRNAAVVWVYVFLLAAERSAVRNGGINGGEKETFAVSAGEQITGERHVYWDFCGCVLTAAMIGEFYGNWRLGTGSLILCVAVFAGFYGMFYWGKRIWPHLIITFIILPMPLVLASRFGWTERIWYLTVAGGFLITGVLARCFSRICEQDERVYGGWRVDWYHALAVLLLFPMAVGGRDGMLRFLYWILLIGYFLQYGIVKPWKAAAWSGAALMGIFAFWSQPFIEWPALLELEIHLLPIVLYLWGMGMLWRKKEYGLIKGQEQKTVKGKWVDRLQTAGYLMCLLVLCTDAWIQQDVANALILEGICLIVLLWALVKRCKRWVRIAAAVLVLVALYMTKGFWLSISWWVYLLTAGIGLILFAAVSERKNV